MSSRAKLFIAYLCPDNFYLTMLSPGHTLTDRLFFILGLLLVSTVFLVEVAMPLNTLITVGYVIIILLTLKLHLPNKYGTALGIISTCLIIISFAFTYYEHKAGFVISVNRVLSILTIWLIMYFNYRYEKKEKELVSMKSKFVTMASHEFRTPLTTILSSAFLLENYDGEELTLKKNTHINKIKQSVNNMTELLNDFILLGKLEEGKIKVICEAIDLTRFQEELQPELNLLKKEHQTIHWEFIGKQKHVCLDKQLLRSICMNLISNAIKYSSTASLIQVILHITDGTLILRVVDQGMGIPLAEQRHVFERFFRAQNAVNIGGTGLGLSIAQKHIKLMNGTIEFESKLNAGSTFTVTLPLDTDNIIKSLTPKQHEYDLSNRRQ